MRFKTLLPMMIFSILSSTMFAADKNILVEIRVPKIVEFSHATFFFVGERTSEANPLKSAALREEGTNNIFQEKVILYSVYKELRYAVIISPEGGRKGVSQVFRLPLRHNSKPADWSQWERPDYFENSQDAMSNFMDDQKSPDRSTNIPPNNFEVRYKIDG